MNKLTLMLVPVALVALSTPAFADIVVNGGFETGDFTGWSIGGAGGPCTFVSNLTVGYNAHCVPQVTIASHSGNYEAAIGDIPTSIYQDLATSAIQYEVSFWLANSPDANGGGGFVPAVVSWGGTQIFSDNNFGPQPYQHYSFNVTGNAGLTRLEIGTVAGQNAANYGALLIDDVSVSAVPDGGTTLALLGLAIVGLAGIRRKLSL